LTSPSSTAAMWLMSLPSSPFTPLLLPPRVGDCCGDFLPRCPLLPPATVPAVPLLLVLVAPLPLILPLLLLLLLPLLPLPPLPAFPALDSRPSRRPFLRFRMAYASLRRRDGRSSLRGVTLAHQSTHT
jgi:hypothetical protein